MLLIISIIFFLFFIAQIISITHITKKSDRIFWIRIKK
jgi:hypothetical protein